MRLAYREILMQSERDRDLEQVLAKLPPSLCSPLRSPRPFLSKLLGPSSTCPDVATLLAAMVEDYRVRAGLDKSAPIYRHRRQVAVHARLTSKSTPARPALRASTSRRFYQGDRPCVQQTEVNLALGIGQKPEHMPGWAWRVLERYDEALSPELKRELLVEGIIVLQRGWDRRQRAISRRKQRPWQRIRPQGGVRAFTSIGDSLRPMANTAGVA